MTIQPTKLQYHVALPFVMIVVKYYFAVSAINVMYTFYVGKISLFIISLCDGQSQTSQDELNGFALSAIFISCHWQYFQYFMDSPRFEDQLDYNMVYY